jgi:hypothetical protein
MSLAYMFQMIQGRGTAVLKKASKSELMSEIIDAQLRETERYGEARAMEIQFLNLMYDLSWASSSTKTRLSGIFKGARYGFNVLTAKSGGSTPSRSHVHETLASRKQVGPSNFCGPHHRDLWM